MSEITTWRVGARPFNAAGLMAEAWAMVTGSGPVAHSMVGVWLAGTPRALPDLIHLRASAYEAKYGTTARRALIALLAGVAAAQGTTGVDTDD